MTLLILLIALIIGLFTRYHILLSILCIIVFLFFVYKKKNKYLFVFSIALFALGIGVSFINFSFERTTFDGFVIESKDNYFILSSRFERFYISNKNNTYEIGDYVSITGNKTPLSFTMIESSFDFEGYLNKKGIYSTIDIDSLDASFLNPVRLRAYTNYFLSKFDDNTADLISKILFANNVDSELTNRLSLLHINRLISVSGFYLYIFLKFITFIASNFLKDKWARLIGLITISFYVVFNITRFAVIRFYVFAVFRYINDYLLKKKKSYYSMLGITGFIFLFIDYHLVYTDAFILGYGCSLFNFLYNTSFTFKRKILKKILNILLLLLFLLPFELIYYNQISLLAYPIQLVISPLFVLFSLSSFVCFYYVPLYNFVNKITIGIEWLTDLVYPIKITINMPQFSDLFIFIYYCVLFVAIYYHSIKFKIIYPYFYLLLTSILVIYSVPIKNRLSNQVSFINVGQGDSCLLRVHNHCLLIDTGGSIYKDIATECLIPYFRKNRIYTLDCVITTHDDYDHSGALSSLCENFDVRNYINEPASFPYDFYGVKLDNYNTFYTTESEENEKSLVISFEINDLKFLIMGDAPISIENQIVEKYPDLRCDVLKIGHHGSDTSTGDKLLDTVKPTDAIISVGKNYYGHPSESVISKIKSRNINIKQTNVDGTITYFGYSI